MFIHSALTIGFLFVAVPLLVHLINMLRHRRQRWAAMDFLLASYRKQKKWIRLRQLLLLLSRLAVAALLIAMLCGWTGGSQVLNMFGGQTTHHVVILDDSYSMGDESLGGGVRLASAASGDVTSGGATSIGTTSVAGLTAYERSLQMLQDLTRRLASSDGNHQLTVMRASRAAMAVRGGSESGDVAADLSAQTITTDARLINRLMSTSASPVRTDLIPALDLAAELVNSNPADSKFLYVASDFREKDWGSAERLSQSLQQLSEDVEIRMIDCGNRAAENLAITELTPSPDVWVAGVPVVINVTVHNYGKSSAENVPLTGRVIRYSQNVQFSDPTLAFSGDVEPLPAMMIESIPAGGSITKSFQVFVTETGTHAIEVSLPQDALPIDNVAVCTLPLTDVEKVLIVDGDPDGRGSYLIASVLNPGSQVRIGAIPDIKPPSFLRSATLEDLSAFRAIYLVDVPQIGENTATVLSQYVQRGGGIAFFLGDGVQADSYNATLLKEDRYLLPAPLGSQSELLAPTPSAGDTQATPNDVQFGSSPELLGPLQNAGEGVLALVGIDRSWQLLSSSAMDNDGPQGNDETDTASDAPRVHTVLERRDGEPLVTTHQVGRGRIITVLTGLDGRWNNWPGDPSFVVFLLQSNAQLWGGAAPPTARFIDQPLTRTLPADQYTGQVVYVPPSDQPPRVPIEIEAERIEPESAGDETVYRVGIDPVDLAIAGEENVDAVLRPGVAEWSLTRSDGSGQVIPVASVLRAGEGDLARADRAAIQQQLLPLEITFVDSTVWSNENRTAGSSTLMLVLLVLLSLFLAIEQLLAYWASYHVTSTPARSSSTTASV